MEKNTKKDLKLTKNDDKLTLTDKITIKELEDKITSMKEDKEKKCKAAKEQLVEMLKVTVDKYRTATGTAEALRVLRFVFDDKIGLDILDVANDVAWQLSDVAIEMVKKAENLPYKEMDKLCEGFYDPEFSTEVSGSYLANGTKLAIEMMKIDLCRNVGGSAEDMVNFIKRTQEEIDATGEKLKQLKANQKKD